MGLFSVLTAGQASVQAIDKIPELNRRENLTVNTKHWLSQLSTPDAKSPVQVKKVNLKVTKTGIEVILETNQGERLQPNTRSEGNTLILDILNSQLVLPNAQEFRSDQPVAGITSVTVTQVDGNIIRVTVIADAGVPKVELFDIPNEALIFGFTLH
ncbi:AMIN domain-containing protein [Nostoc sp.]|uniref:AMIN domain-containing protein n=1 Tax=Nostoc sp. TaxID=1180 RepID=UPI002FF9A523